MVLQPEPAFISNILGDWEIQCRRLWFFYIMEAFAGFSGTLMHICRSDWAFGLFVRCFPGSKSVVLSRGITNYDFLADGESLALHLSGYACRGH